MTVVVTVLLTNTEDPQRGVTWSPDLQLVGKWASSIRGAKAVVLVDHAVGDLSSAEIVSVESSTKSPYVARWDRVVEYLSSVDDELVWVTDGTDVVMLREPWSEMSANTLYVGSEPETVGFWWMKEAHQDPGALAWIESNSHLPLLNAGLVGGSRETVIDFIDDLRRSLEKHPDGSDMAVFNMVAHSRPHVTGAQVHTVFRSFSDNGVAWWMHK